MADVMRSEPLADPDAQATVTEFIDYTEHLPSDVRRSLALIEKLNDAIHTAQHEVHMLTKRWNAGVVATDDATADEVAVDLRARISYQKNLSSRYAAAALAEAARMNDEISRHQKLLKVTGVKLDALPLPPSRDPTPQPVQPHSPQAMRSAGARGGDTGTIGPAIKLRIGNNRISARPVAGTAPRSRRKRIIVPGEVLPPPNPDSPTPSDISDWESPPPLPIRTTPKLESRSRADKSTKIKISKPLKPPKSDVPKIPKKERAPRPAGVMGTNVHSQVAGISTSNALAKLTPPPPDAPVGGEHAPWMRLTEYEMAKLRKRMKKNAIWNPSDTMIRRELNDAGRGPENYRKAKQSAEDGATKFVDCDDLVNRDPDRPLVAGEIPLETIKTKLINKGMSLNVQKKEKKALMQKQMAEQARLEAEQAARNLGQLGETFKNLFERDKPIEKIVLKTPANRKRKRESAAAASEESQIHSQLHSEIIVTPATASKPPKKQRKATSSSASLPRPLLSPAAPGTGSSSIAAASASPVTATTTTTTTIPLAAPAASPVKSPREGKEGKEAAKDSKEKTPATQQHPPSPAPPRKETRRLSLVIKPPADPNANAIDSAPSTTTTTAITNGGLTTGTGARPPSRPASRRASVGPPPESSIRDRPRRKSATPSSAMTAPHTPLLPLTGTSAPIPTLASRRTKRPAPGVVTNGGQDGGTAISASRRQKRPGKKGGGNSGRKADAAAAAAAVAMKDESLPEEDEPVDPNEPRYCLCGDVSWGTMIKCENAECEKEWFHLECVGLSDIPSKRSKWWCPDCHSGGKNKNT